MKAVVIGGGLGGVAAAVALRKVGWEVDVHERAPEFGEVGAGIGLFPNALSAIAQLGLEAEVRRLGTPRVSGGVRSADGSWLTKMPEVGQQELVAIHRADLHRTLVNALPSSCLHTNAEITSLDLDADLVVAADGIRSHARALLFPDLPGPVYAGATAWRGIAPGPFKDIEVSQGLGPGKEVGILPIGGGRVYWYGAMVASPGQDLDLRAEFGDWHDPLPRLMADTPPEVVLRHDIHWLATPLPSYVRGNVALLGDAAHAMVPYLGQGACMAMEDAVVLASCVASGDVSEGLARYDRERRPRTQQIVTASRWAGRLGFELRNPAGIALRNTLFRLTPPKVAVKSMTRFSGWRAPELLPVS